MKFTEINPTTKVAKVDKSAFVKNNEKIIDICQRIISSHQKLLSPKELERSKNHLYTICSNLFLDGDATFYILTRDKKPVSFCLFSQKSNNANLELVFTNAKMLHGKNASLVLEHGLCDLKACGIQNVDCNVLSKNETSVALYSKVAKLSSLEAKTKQDEQENLAISF